MEQVPTILYWALALLVVLPFVSFQLSLAAYFLLVHLKLTGIGYESAVALNLENAIAIVILPTILLLRTRFAGFRLMKKPGSSGSGSCSCFTARQLLSGRRFVYQHSNRWGIRNCF